MTKLNSSFFIISPNWKQLKYPSISDGKESSVHLDVECCVSNWKGQTIDTFKNIQER